MATEEGARGLPVYMTPDAELSRARYFLTGWTLARYASRFRADQRLGDDDEADGVDPPPAGPARSGGPRRVHPVRRPDARVHVAPRACSPSHPPPPSDRCAEPRGPSLGSPSSLSTRPSPPPPALLARRRSATSRRLTSSPPPPWTPPPVTTSAGSPAEASSARSSARSTRACSPPSPRAGRPRGVSVPPRKPRRRLARRSNRPRRDGIRGGDAVHLRVGARVVRAGDDGDACHIAFADTTLLDFVSRGLDARSLSEKRPGDFEPCHRIGVYAESRDETVRAPFANTRERHEDDDDTRDEASDGKSASEHEHESEEVEGSIDPPRWSPS